MAVLLAAFAAGPRALAAAQTFSLDTPHYQVQTDISPAFAQLVAKHMEAIFLEYSSLFRNYGQVTSKFRVIVYGHEADYRQAIPQGYWGSAGIFISASQVLVAHAEKRTTEDVLRTLYHEGFHQFMFEAVAQDSPVWVNEGIAEYFSNATWNGRTFALGEVPAIQLYVIQQKIKNGSCLPFARLFRLTSEEWRSASAGDQRQAGLLYTEAWSVVHFLVHAENGRYSSMLDRYLKAVSQGQGFESALTDVFGKDYGQFEQSWARYVMALKPSPKFACRDNMECLLLLAKFVYTDPRALKSVTQLRQDVLYQNRAGWQITRPTGEKLSSDQPDQVVALFRCPLDQGGGEISYIVIHDGRTGMPTLVCTHHPGVVELAYYERDGAGGLKVTVEEQVWETLTPDMQQAILAASR